MKKTTTKESEEFMVSESDTVKEETIISKDLATAVSSNQKKAGTVVYIGPTIENVVTKNIVFNNGLPKHLSNEIEKQPLINNLLVPINQLAKARNELRNPESSLSIVYGKIKTKQEE